MIRRKIIRVLLAFMLIAFIAVVSVQWIWIKSSIQERNDRFLTKVYDVLSQAVGFIDEMDSKRILVEMGREIDEIQQEFRKADTLGRDTSRQDIRSLLPSGFYLPEGNYIEHIERYSNGSNLIIRFNTGPALQEDKYLSRKFIEQLGDYLGITQQGDKTERDRKEILEVLSELYVRIANESESIDIKIDKLRKNRDIDLMTYIREKLRDKDIRIPFTYEILEEKAIQQRSIDRNIKGFYYAMLFPKLDSVKKYYLAIIFDSTESLDSLIYENMDWMFITSAFLILGLMSIFIVTIVVITRQQKLSTIKNDFINNMTHEFKTPLATISLATSALEKEKVLNDKNQILKFNNIIRGENERMDKYVERILLQAKLDRREIHLKKVNVNLNVLVDEAVQHFRLQVDNVGGTLKEELDPEGYVIHGDEVHLFNVFCNLIDNAIKYSGNLVDILVFTRREGNYFIIGVQDHGIGIPKEAQKKVFKRFYRVPSGNVHNVKGFGLGLSYVKSIVYLHGGDLRLTSKKNKGTLIEVLFKME